MTTKMIAENALDPIADHGAGIRLARDRETDAGRTIIRKVMEHEDRRRGAMALREDGIEFRSCAYPRAARVTVGAFDDGLSAIHERPLFMPATG